MDFLADANTLATLTGLVVSFFSERRSDKEASVDEFKAWLATGRHDEIVRLLESNISTTVGVKAMLHQSQGEVLALLREIKLRLESPAGPKVEESVAITENDIEVVLLGEGNVFIGGEGELERLATRFAIKAIGGAEPIFEVRLAPTVLNSQPADPLVIPRYEAARTQAAKRLSSRLRILTSPGVYEWWNYFLSTKEQWVLAIKSLIDFARLDSSVITGHSTKIDLWRTVEPKLSAPIYLSPSEVALLLDHLDFSSTSDLRFGPYWRSAIDLPFSLIAKHTIPRIVAQLELRDVKPEGEVLNLLEWHIGEG